MHSLKTHLLIGASLFGLGFVVTASAQAQTEQATGIADPSRIEEQFRTDRFIPDVGEDIEVESRILQNVPAGAENIIFTLNSITLEGVSAYSADELASLYEDKLGTEVSLADIYAISSALTNKYRNEGFILTQVVVPPQTIDGGNVRLQVVEGYVDRILIEGDEESGLNVIRNYASNIRTGDALNIQDLERFLLLINDLPGVSARSILSPSRTQVGASDLRIIVTRDLYDALIGVDNFGSRYLGPLQFTGSGALNSFFGNNEKITGQFVTATDVNEPELFYGALNYEQPINSIGTLAKVFISHSDTQPGYDLEEFDVNGRSTYMGAGLEHPFIRSRARNLRGRLQFDWREVESSNDIDPITREDNIRALRIGTNYEFLDTVFGVGVNVIDIEVSQGLDVFGASNKGDANLTRAAADPDSFTKVVAEVQRLQRVAQDVTLLMAARGQLSNNPLVSSEEFGVGGINYGRGFDASEIIGEDGFATKVELQWSQPFEAPVFQNYELYSFYDFGKVWNDDATIADDDESLASIGAGIRAEFLNDIEGGFSVAFPLTRDVDAQEDDDPRFYFNVSRSF